MRRVVVRGLLARKLRLALTLLAVALGVSLISATYIFTDTINGSFDRIFTQTNKGTDVAITPHQLINTADQGGTRQTVPASVLAKVKANPAGADRRGRGLRRRHRARQERQARRQGRCAELHQLGRRQSALRGLQAEGGPPAADRRRGDRSTRPPHASRGSSSATSSPSRPAAPRKDYTLVGFTQIAGVDSLRRGDRRRHDPPRGPARAGQGRRASTASWPPPSRASRPEALVKELRAELPADRQRPHGAGRGREAVQGPLEQPRVPEDDPARLRRHLAVRRLVHHLQLLLDHGPAADPRARRCCARSVRAAGRCSRSVAQRGPDPGRRRVDPGDPARPRARARAEGAVPGRRRRPARERRSSSSRARSTCR